MFFLVPHPFKIEAFLQNSLSLQCTYLCNSWRLSVYGLDVTLTRCVCLYRCWPTTGAVLKADEVFVNTFIMLLLFQQNISSIKTLRLQNMSGGKRWWLSSSDCETEGNFYKPWKRICINTQRSVLKSCTETERFFFFLFFFKHAYSDVDDTHLVLVSAHLQTETSRPAATAQLETG